MLRGWSLNVEEPVYTAMVLSFFAYARRVVVVACNIISL